MRSLGKSLAEIFKEVSLSRSTVQYVLKPKAKKHGVQLGRPRKINAREKKVIREAVKRFKANDERVSAQKILNATRLNVSSRTIHDSLKEKSLKYKNQNQRIILSDED